jgi:DNA-binding beta-propeller fold protein YncE
LIQKTRPLPIPNHSLIPLGDGQGAPVIPLRVLFVLAVVLLALAAIASPASADRGLLNEHLLQTGAPSSSQPPPEGEIEGACGLTVAPGGPIYVSDYYHRVVDLFSTAGNYQSQIALPGSNQVFGTNTLDAVCGLALDSAGVLYANELHQGALRLLPGEAMIDGAQSTGVAVDGAGNLYVDDRTHIAEYAAPVSAADPPIAEIGAGSLGDGYGLAVSASGARVYVADASDQTVKVYEPPVAQPAQTIAGFNSLRNAALAVDPTNEHLLVVDNSQPGFEHPKAAIDEYSASGAFLGRLPGAPVDGEPSGLAVDPASGNLYVTDGNSELSNVFAYGSYGSTAAPGSFLARPSTPSTPPATTAAVSAVAPPTARRPPSRRSGASASEVIQRGRVRVKVDGRLAPTALPRQGTAGVHVSLDTEIAATNGGTPPQLRQIAIAINRNGHFEPRGVPVCRLAQIQPSTTAGALAACRGSLVGEGRFSADVKLPEQSPFPSAGKVLAFNGSIGCSPSERRLRFSLPPEAGRPQFSMHNSRDLEPTNFHFRAGRLWPSSSRTQGGRGGERAPARDPNLSDRGQRDAPCHSRPAILAHVFGTKPVPTSFTLTFAIGSARGTYGTVLRAAVPEATGNSGFITGLSLNLGRSFSFRGQRRSYLSAGCPAPKGFPGAVFPLAKMSFGFQGARTLSSTLTRSCTARG